MACRDFILPEPASYVFFYAIFNLRNLLYIIELFIAYGISSPVPSDAFRSPSRWGQRLGQEKVTPKKRNL